MSFKITRRSKGEGLGESLPFDEFDGAIFVCGMSRTGTTLMSTVLDSNPSVAMGYELLPVDPMSDDIVRRVLSVEPDTDGDVVRSLQAIDDNTLTAFARNTRKCGGTLGDLQAAVQWRRDSGVDDPLLLRVGMAATVAMQRARRERARHWGFKLNTGAFASLEPHLPANSKFIFMLRDPRDVVASHIEREFGKSTEEVARAWKNYLANFEKLVASVGPARATIVRYEDFVKGGPGFVTQLALWAGVEPHESMLEHHTSDASIHQHRHANSKALAQPMFDSSISRWVGELDDADVDQVVRSCGKEMVAYEYTAGARSARRPSFGVRALTATLVGKKKFSLQSYGRLLDRILPEGELLLLRDVCEAVGGPQRPPAVTIRHDIDHDLETALELGRYEADRGVYATYCVLHTAPYYGELVGDRYRHTGQVVEACRELQGLGHEINFHNNLVSVALLHGLSAADLLRSELEFWRANGVAITGTSTHGDKLCGELGFRNRELFSECLWEKLGGRRTVSFEDNSIELGAVSMAEFGLTYEAYDVPRELYISDSGGRPRAVIDAAGRGGLKRKAAPHSSPFERLTGLLTHPIWWDGSGESTELGDFPSVDELVEANLAQRAQRREERAQSASEAQAE